MRRIVFPLVAAILATASTAAAQQKYLATAQLHLANQEWAEAHAVLAPHMEEFPDSPEMHYLYALTLANMSPDSVTKAIHELKEADRLLPEAGGEDGEGEAMSPAEMRENIAQALQALWGAEVNEAVAALNAGDLATARAEVDEAIELNPEGKEAYVVLGAIHQAEADYEAALEAFDEAREIDPAYKEATLRIGQTWQLIAEERAAGEADGVAGAEEAYGNAIEAYEAYLEDHPGDLEVQTQLAEVLLTLGRFDEAEPIVRSVMANEETTARVFTNLGLRVAQANRMALADSLLSRAIEMTASRDPEPLSYLALVRIQQNDLEGARGILLAQLELEPSNPEAWTYLGSVERDLRNEEAAREALGKANAIPLALESLRVRRTGEATVMATATFSNRMEQPVEGIIVEFRLVGADGTMLGTERATVAQAGLGPGELDTATVEFTTEAEDARVLYEIVGGGPGETAGPDG